MSVKNSELDAKLNSKKVMMVPDWLTESFIEGHLKNHYENDELKIVRFEVMSAGGYLSLLYRVNVTVNIPSTDGCSDDDQNLTLSLMVKEAITDEAALSILQQYDVYNKEIEFYDKISPKIAKKLRDLGEPKLLAECFGVCKERQIMILENLAIQGYGIVHVLPGFNIHEAKVILKKLASFHAVCAVLQEEQSDIFENFKNGRLSREIDAFNDYYMSLYDIAVETISSLPDFTVYANKLRAIRSEVIERWRCTYDLKPNHFNSLNHDDLFAPNLLLKFKQNEEVAFENVIFIDFQFSYWSSPTTDLHFFLNTSLNESLRHDSFKDLLHFYYANLIGFLQKLHYKQHIPTWSEFYEQYQERHFEAFVISCLIFPLFGYNDDQVSLDVLVRNNEEGMQAKRKIFRREGVQQVLQKLIPYFDKLGIFD